MSLQTCIEGGCPSSFHMDRGLMPGNSAGCKMCHMQCHHTCLEVTMGPFREVLQSQDTEMETFKTLFEGTGYPSTENLQISIYFSGCFLCLQNLSSFQNFTFLPFPLNFKFQPLFFFLCFQKKHQKKRFFNWQYQFTSPRRNIIPIGNQSLSHFAIFSPSDFTIFSPGTYHFLAPQESYSHPVMGHFLTLYKHQSKLLCIIQFNLLSFYYVYAVVGVSASKLKAFAM